MNAILLAAGYGTRLLPITKNTPKCLVKINNDNLLNIWIKKLVSAKVNDILVNTHYLSDQVENFLKKNLHTRKIKIFKEKELLGTAGTLIANLNFYKKEDGLLIHADNYCAENLNFLIDAHKKRPKECLMTMLTFECNDPLSCGIVQVNNKGIVVNFYEKSNLDKGQIANGAVYILSPEFIEIIKTKYSKAKDFSNEIIKNFLGRIYTYKTKKYFADMGTPEEYKNIIKQKIKID